MPPTNIILTPIGSGGDVHPFVGVGRALRERGHDVTEVPRPGAGQTETRMTTVSAQRETWNAKVGGALGRRPAIVNDTARRSRP